MSTAHTSHSVFKLSSNLCNIIYLTTMMKINQSIKSVNPFISLTINIFSLLFPLVYCSVLLTHHIAVYLYVGEIRSKWLQLLSAD